VGEALAAELLADRSPDLVRMMRERGANGVNLYIQQATEGVIQAVNSDEVDIPSQSRRTRSRRLSLNKLWGV
jgi:ABC-type Fe3+-citrate transport system substrate-binding protein